MAVMARRVGRCKKSFMLFQGRSKDEVVVRVDAALVLEGDVLEEDATNNPATADD